MKKFQMVAGFALVTSIGALAFAGGGHGKGKFHNPDANGDGKVTLEEMLAGAKARFDKKDANNDGVLTKDEVHERMQWLIEKADTNKDGKVTTAEHEAGVKLRFTRRDANKNGVLEGDELRHGHGHGHGKRGNKDRSEKS